MRIRNKALIMLLFATTAHAGHLKPRGTGTGTMHLDSWQAKGSDVTVDVGRGPRACYLGSESVGCVQAAGAQVKIKLENGITFQQSNCQLEEPSWKDIAGINIRQRTTDVNLFELTRKADLNFSYELYNTPQAGEWLHVTSNSTGFWCSGNSIN